MSPEVQNTPIKGYLTFRQIVGYTVAVFAVATLYYNMIERVRDARNVSDENNQILHEIRQDRKEEARMNNVRISDIENRQRADNIRITILETQANKEE
jgi:hypothetical protein